MELLFQISSTVVLPIWLLMILLPKWRITHMIMASLWSMVPMALLYAIFVVPKVPTFLGELANPKLDQITKMLGTAEGATIAWIHFLAFDLFVGRWIYLDSREQGLSPWLVGIALFFTLMFGPLGLLIYLGIRPITKTKTLRS